jgi:UPF0176 protein
LQCENCNKKFNGCCSHECSNFLKLDPEKQKELFKSGKIIFTAQKSKKIKPRLKDHK